MKKNLFIIAFLTSQFLNAQVKSVSLEASGLTCSMCSNAINKALKTLDFVAQVQADIKTYSFFISFKPNMTIDLDGIRKKVESAGFSVSAFYATVYFDQVRVQDEQPSRIGDQQFHFVNAPGALLNGDRTIKIVDRGFVRRKEFKKNKYSCLPVNNYHVSL